MKSKRQQIYKVSPDEIPNFLRQIHKKSDFDFNKLISDTSEIELSNRLLNELRSKIKTGANFKRIHLRFDLKKGKRFWEFEGSNETANKSSPEFKKKKANLTIETKDSKSDSGIFSSFLNVIKTQLHLGSKPSNQENKSSENESQTRYNKS